MIEGIYKCQNCKTIICNNENQCSKCGCKNRHISITITDQVKFYEDIHGKAKGVSDKKPRSEFMIGDNLYRKTNEWNSIYRLIDRGNDWYKEHIINKKGKYIRNVNQRLSQHRGHGSAKRRK